MAWIFSYDKCSLLSTLLVFNNPNGVVGQNTFTVGGFRNWKKVGGKDCYFQSHIEKDPNSAHRVADQKCKDLMN